MIESDHKGRRRHRVRNLMLAALFALAALLVFLFRDCLGLGAGTGEGIGIPGPTDPQVLLGDASAPDDARPSRCELHLTRSGLTINGAPGAVADAVRTCERADETVLHVTGDALAGMFIELRNALTAAGVEFKLREE